ncbi:MAG TPA: hypothetical protein VGX92_04795 [Pyrinomonadaceae bacterium]|nr:hypothetical protein [Pyrinomonadaceae bacterium]
MLKERDAVSAFRIAEGIEGSGLYDYFCVGCDEEMAAYCMRDVEPVREIYLRMSFEEGA